MTPKAAEWQAWKYSAVMQSSCGAKDGTIWSCTAYIIAIPQRLSFEPRYVLQVGLSFPLELLPAQVNLSVGLNKNMNKLLCLESATSAVLQIMWSCDKIPLAFSLHFCILQAIKNWRCRGPGNKGRLCFTAILLYLRELNSLLISILLTKVTWCI